MDKKKDNLEIDGSNFKLHYFQYEQGIAVIFPLDNKNIFFFGVLAEKIQLQSGEFPHYLRQVSYFHKYLKNEIEKIIN